MLDISTKNIGQSSWNVYEKRMTESGTELISKMQWKLFHYKEKLKRRKGINCGQNQSNIEDNLLNIEDICYYGLKAIKEAPYDPDLKHFENGFYSNIVNFKETRLKG